MIVYFIRHGQTDWNKALRWQGRSDIALNATGLAQACAVRDYFKQQKIIPSAIVSSPKQRALRTAQTIAEGLDVTVIIEPQFVELDLGDFEGKTTDELHAQYGQVFTDWLAQHHLVAAPQGENIEQAIKRMQLSLEKHIAQRETNLLIVAHQAILMAMKTSLSGRKDHDSLAAYKQTNNEIDVWDVKKAKMIQRIEVTYAQK